MFILRARASVIQLCTGGGAIHVRLSLLLSLLTLRSMDISTVFPWFIFVVASLESAYSMKRTIHFYEDPGCEKYVKICENKNWTTVYLKADGPNDTLHYIWDFGGKPSILLAVTSPLAQLDINWEAFLLNEENSITFLEEEPSYTFGIIINQIIEFNDINDTALLNTANAVNINILRPEFFHWSRKSLSLIGESVSLDMEGNSYKDTTKNISRYGSIQLSLNGFCFTDHSETMPHMLHTENSTQVDFVFHDLQTNETFSSSRFAIELLAVGGGDPDIAMSIDPKKSLDDERTPGIFEVIEVKTPPFARMNERERTGAYLQWRPVSYVTSARDVTSSTETVQYPPLKVANHTNAIRNSMLYGYYGEKANESLVQRVIISLGSKGDGFYKRTRYTTWTFIVGYGTPPEEQFSYIVILIVSIGLGVPLFIMSLTGLYFCARSASKRNSNAYLNR